MQEAQAVSLPSATPLSTRYKQNGAVWGPKSTACPVTLFHPSKGLGEGV
jgi:hypothetical protein